MKKYIIVGGVAAGASAAARLRRNDEFAEIIIVEKGPFVSFSNCALPYRIGEEVESDEDLIMMTPEKFLEQYNIKARVNSEVIEVNEREHKVIIKDLVDNRVYEEEYDDLVLAVGAKAIVPPFSGLENMDYFTIKTVPDVTKFMKALVEKPHVKKISVVGGGFIGIEVAENLINRGFEVTLIEGSDQILAPFDYEMAISANKILRDKGVEIKLGNFVHKFTDNGIMLENGDEVETDLVVLAIGVRPETEFLKDTSIELSDTGHIIVNEDYMTTVPHIYAGGDAILVRNQLTGGEVSLPLAGPANKQGRQIADKIAGKEILNTGYIGSSIIGIFDYIFTSTGLNEKTLTSLNIFPNYRVVYAAPTDKVSIMPDVNKLYFKLIFDGDTGKILGTQGYSKGNIDKRMDVIATAIKGNMTVRELADLELVYAPNYATGKEAVNKLGYMAEGIVSGEYDVIPFTSIYDLVEEDAQIIDVRGESEYAEGHIKNVKNIPMSEFRSSLDQIDKTERVYVQCQSGQRSYNVTRALLQRGYDAVNVSGGYLFLSQYEKELQKINPDRKNILIK